MVIKSEFSLNSLRIDTLAFDKSQKSFVIIEYKRNENFSVIDQGYAYLALLLNNKADFILEYNEATGNSLSKNDVDWEQSKVIFIAPSFTNYQRKAISFKDLPIELWGIKRYINNLISFMQILPTDAQESIKTIQRGNTTISKVNSEVKIYSEENHFEGKSQSIVELYNLVKNYILNLGGNILIKPTKLYIGFKTKTNFCDVLIQKNGLKIWLNMSFNDISDPLNLVRDVSNIGHYGNGNCQIAIKNTHNLEYIISLIRQSYES